MRKILLTGAAGKIGKCLMEGLDSDHRYTLVGSDVNTEDGLVQLNVVDKNRWLELTQGVDTILHFGWAPDEEDFLGKVLPNNVTGAYHLYEAARENGVKRVIFASSNHATGFYEVHEDVEPDEPYRPDSFYGLSKCYIELLGRLYADKHGISSINIRIGNYAGDNRPHSERAAHIWISCRDMVQLVTCCIEADRSIDFLSLYGTSNNTHNYYDISYLEDLIGYKPQDDAEALLEQASKRGERIPDDETKYQGGKFVYK